MNNMIYLIGDIGNTETKFCILDKNYKIIRKFKFDTFNIYKKNFLKKKIFPFIHNKVKNKKVFFSSVVPSVFFIVKKFLKKNFKINSIELKKTSYEKLIKLKVNKKQIGSDRIANAIGSYHEHKCNCIVVDFGTATTFDVIKKGVYMGGVIAPGVSISLKTLIKNR